MSEFIDDELLALPTELQVVWDDLGITRDEQENALNDLNQAIINAKIEYLRQIQERRDKILESINLRRQTLCMITQALPHSEEEMEEIRNIGSKGTLRERSLELDRAAEKYKAEYEKASAKFIDIKIEMDKLFDRLEYTESDKGEFAEIGYADLSDERLDRFKRELQILEQEAKKRIEILEKNEEKINEFLVEIDEPMHPQIKEICEKKIITSSSFTEMGRYFDQIQALRHARSSKYSELALILTNLWELLEIPEEERLKFISTHNKLSTQSIQGIFEESQKLSKIKIERLPELIEKALARIDKDCKTLHKTNEEKACLLHQLNTCQTKLDAFNKLQEICAKLQREIVLSAQALAMIEQRSQIIQAYNEVKEMLNEQNYQKSLTKESEIQNSIKSDKAKRRFNFVLPRLEKKLLMSLIEFKQATGFDLTYDGEVYIEKLVNIELSHDEIKRAKMGGRRQSYMVNKKQIEGIITDNRQRRKTEWPTTLME